MLSRHLLLGTQNGRREAKTGFGHRLRWGPRRTFLVTASHPLLVERAEGETRAPGRARLTLNRPVPWSRDGKAAFWFRSEMIDRRMDAKSCKQKEPFPTRG